MKTCLTFVAAVVATLACGLAVFAGTSQAYFYDNYCDHNLTAGSYCDSHEWSLLRYNEGTSVDGGSVCVKAFHYPSNAAYGDYLCDTYYARHCYSGTQDAYGRLKNGGGLTHPYLGFVVWLVPGETVQCS
jgi:hypothetical protein